MSSSPGEDTINVGECIPIACHYNDCTLLTKNGELLQIIRVDLPKCYTEDINSRHKISAALGRHSDINVAFWIHSVRNRLSVDDYSLNNNLFAAVVEEDRNHDTGLKIFENVVYISVVVSGSKGKLGAIRHLFSNYVFGSHRRYLRKKIIELEDIVEQVIEDLRPFQASKLMVVRNEDGSYTSELSTFIARLVNFTHKSKPMISGSVAEQLTAGNSFVFDANSLSFRVGGSDQKTYAVMLVVKGYGNLSEEIMYRLMHIQAEFVITQVVDHKIDSELTADIRKQRYFLGISKAEELVDEVGLDVPSSEAARKKDVLVLSQTSIMLYANSEQELEQVLHNFMSHMVKVGLAVSRMDLRLEQMFWAQIPGNFYYLDYRNICSQSAVGMFTSYYTGLSGCLGNNITGQYHSLMHNSLDLPYYYNLFYCGNGHTLIVGNRQPRAVISNYILTGLTKTGCRIIILDYKSMSRAFVNAVSGRYVKIPCKQKAKSDLNIFSAAYSGDPGEDAIVNCLIKMSDAKPEKKEIIRDVVRKILKQPAQERTLEKAAADLKKHDLDISAWIDSGKHAGVFDGGSCVDLFAKKGQVVGFDLTEVIHNKTDAKLVLRYILGLVESLLGQEMVVVVFNNMNVMQMNTALDGKSQQWLERLEQYKSAAIFHTDYSNLRSLGVVVNALPQIKTRIVIPDYNATAIDKVFEIPRTVLYAISNTHAASGLLAVQRIRGNVSEEFQLLKVKVNEASFYPILCGGKSIMKKIVACRKQYGQNVENWLPRILNGFEDK